MDSRLRGNDTGASMMCVVIPAKAGIHDDISKKVEERYLQLLPDISGSFARGILNRVSKTIPHRLLDETLKKTEDFS